MGLAHGTDQSFDKAFAEATGSVIVQMGEKVVFSKKGFPSVSIYPVYGDCTAASIYTQSQHSEGFYEVLPNIIKYLSANGRISVFFSRKVYINYIERELGMLKKFHLSSLDIQYSNRCTGREAVMISGLLKIPNPYVKYRYCVLGGVDVNEYVSNVLKHEHFDTTDNDALRKQYLGEK